MVFSPIEENEESSGEELSGERLLDGATQSLKAFPHIHGVLEKEETDMGREG